MEHTRLPAAFAEKMQGLLKDEWNRFASSYDEENYQALRFNSLKKGLTEEKYGQIFDQLKKNGEFTPVPWAEHAFYYDDSVRPGKHPYHEAGLYYIQEPSAMSAAALLAPRPGMRVLDLCAAPGGKTTQLASYLDRQGILIANEIHPARCRILSQNVERMGIGNAIVTNEDSSKLAERFPAYFHAILVDAPCSGEGMFRKNPEAVEEWSKRQVDICAARQREILDNAAKMLLPGGVMVYSTCTFSPEENEQTVVHFLAGHSDFSLEEREAPWFCEGRPEWGDGALELKKTFRLWSHQLRGEGHFAAVFRRRGVLPEKFLQQEKSKKAVCRWTAEQRKIFAEFAYSTLAKEAADRIFAGNPALFKDELWLLPEEAPSLAGLRTLRAGLQIGAFKKNRFEPSHALALALGKSDVCRAVDLGLGDSRTNAYFAGETLQIGADSAASDGTPTNGWALVCVEGFSAGWGKLVGNQLKNHYPKGLRRIF